MGQKAWEIENFLEQKNNQLYIGGVSAIELSEKFGTPLFVFSESRIKENINRLKAVETVIDCPLKICYAAKANSNMAILRVVKEAGSDIEVNSGGELMEGFEDRIHGRTDYFQRHEQGSLGDRRRDQCGNLCDSS